MPIFEYECKKCFYSYNTTNYTIPQGQIITGNPPCPDTQKIVSLSSFQLKGQGWATDGYSNKKGE